MSTPIWARPEPKGRGRENPLSRRGIVGVAIAIADDEGIEAVSMRRLARELHAGAMSLYHYFENRDELLELMIDTVAGEMVVPELPARVAAGARGRGPPQPRRCSAATPGCCRSCRRCPR